MVLPASIAQLKTPQTAVTGLFELIKIRPNDSTLQRGRAADRAEFNCEVYVGRSGRSELRDRINIQSNSVSLISDDGLEVGEFHPGDRAGAEYLLGLS